MADTTASSTNGPEVEPEAPAGPSIPALHQQIAHLSRMLRHFQELHAQEVLRSASYKVQLDMIAPARDGQ